MIWRQPLVRLLVEDVLNAIAGVVVPAAEGLGVADGFRPGEGIDEGQAGREALLEPPHQRMVVGESSAGGLKPVIERDQLPVEDRKREQAAQLRIDRGWNDRTRRPRLAGVEILPAVEPRPLTARIGNLGHQAITQLALHAYIPVLNVSVLEIDAEGIRPWSERPDRGVIEQITDKGLTGRRPELK